MERHVSCSVKSDLNTNPKRFWSILKLNSKSHTGNRTPLRSAAENPREIANLFNPYFASVFAHDTSSPLPPPPPPSSGSASNAPASPDMSELTLTVSEVQSVLEALDATKATRSVKFPAKLLKETASVIAPSLCKLFNKSLSAGSFPQNWKEAHVVPVFKKGEVECTETQAHLLNVTGIQSLRAMCI